MGTARGDPSRQDAASLCPWDESFPVCVQLSGGFSVLDVFGYIRKWEVGLFGSQGEVPSHLALGEVARPLLDQRVIVFIPADFGKGGGKAHLWEGKGYRSNSLPSEQHIFLDNSAKLSLLSALERTAGFA